MLQQTFKNKLGEITYRRRLTQQQLGERKIFTNEPGKQEFKNTLKEKLKNTQKTFKKLQKKGFALSPYLEIGSEHGLRPALLESQFGAYGFATDISFYSLANVAKFAKLFNFKKVPKTICCDAENLPFKSNSFPFIFIYETLHHFPNPAPVLKEAHRVLAPGGRLLIGAEPVKQSLQIQFWRRPTKLRFWEKLLKYTLILPFISHIGKTEVEAGILEEAFPSKVWGRSLAIFDKISANFRAFPFGPSQKIDKDSNNNWLKLKIPTRVGLWLFGGGIEAVCQKTNGKMKKLQAGKLENLLICPECLAKQRGEVGLKKIGNSKFNCGKCTTTYQRKNGVLILLGNSLKQRLLGNLN